MRRNIQSLDALREAFLEALAIFHSICKLEEVCMQAAGFSDSVRCILFSNSNVASIPRKLEP